MPKWVTTKIDGTSYTISFPDKMNTEEINEQLDGVMSQLTAPEEIPSDKEIDALIGSETNRLDATEGREELINILKKEEGVHRKSYDDARGFRTVGVGFNMDAGDAEKIWGQADIAKSFADVKSGTAELNDEEVNSLLTFTAKKSKDNVRKHLPNFDSLSPNRQAAAISLNFQVGDTGFGKFKGFLKAMKSEDFTRAAEELMYVNPSKKNKTTDLFNVAPNRVKRAMQILQQDVSLKEAEDFLVGSADGGISPDERLFA